MAALSVRSAALSFHNMRGPERGVLDGLRPLDPPGVGDRFCDFVGDPLVFGVRGIGFPGVRLGVALCEATGVDSADGDSTSCGASSGADVPVNTSGFLEGLAR